MSVKFYHTTRSNNPEDSHLLSSLLRDFIQVPVNLSLLGLCFSHLRVLRHRQMVFFP